MTIKVGDIVKYNGVEARLMRISDDKKPKATLAASGIVLDGLIVTQLGISN